jgi:hypothetical protein
MTANVMLLLRAKIFENLINSELSSSDSDNLLNVCWWNRTQKVYTCDNLIVSDSASELINPKTRTEPDLDGLPVSQIPREHERHERSEFSSPLSDAVFLSLRVHESFRSDQRVQTICICRLLHNERLAQDTTTVPIPIQGFAANPMGNAWGEDAKLSIRM